MVVTAPSRQSSSPHLNFRVRECRPRGYMQLCCQLCISLLALALVQAPAVSPEDVQPNHHLVTDESDSEPDAIGVAHEIVLPNTTHMPSYTRGPSPHLRCKRSHTHRATGNNQSTPAPIALTPSRVLARRRCLAGKRIAWCAMHIRTIAIPRLVLTSRRHLSPPPLRCHFSLHRPFLLTLCSPPPLLPASLTSRLRRSSCRSRS